MYAHMYVPKLPLTKLDHTVAARRQNYDQKVIAHDHKKKEYKNQCLRACMRAWLVDLGV